MTLKVAAATVGGFEAVTVDNDVLALTLVPALGGKLASLRDQRTGREWLWRHPRLPYQLVPHGSSYVALADTGGWDECFPTVAACAYPSAPWAGAALQDHGELWSQTAALEVETTPAAVTLRTRWQGVALPYTFERALTVAAGSATVRLAYACRNHAGAPMAVIWSAHPLLAIAPGMQLKVPSTARFNCWATVPGGLLPAQQGLTFPLTAGGHDLSTLPPASAALALKLWSDPLPAQAGWAALAAPDGELRFSWDPAELPQMAFWLNLGAWAYDGGEPYYNLGLEPCFGAQDSLAEAVEVHRLHATLPPGGEKTWALTVTLSTSTA